MSALDRLKSRVQMFLARSLVESVDDTTELQEMKISVMDGEIQEGVERIQNYGMSSNPPKGSGAVVVYVQGNRDDGIIISTDSGEHRATGLNPGEVIVYSEYGVNILLNDSGQIEIAGNTDNAIRFSKMELAYNALKDKLNALIATYNTHVHNETGSTTTVPTTVQTPTNANMTAAKVDEVLLP